jgi:hypothetical protein
MERSVFFVSEKLALKTPNVLVKMAFFVDFALFFNDGLLRYGTLGYGALENSVKNGLPTVLSLKDN